MEPELLRSQHFDAIIHPAERLEGHVQAQPSKNYTTRFLLAAALSTEPVWVRGVAQSEDAQALIACLRSWGAQLELDGPDARVSGFGARPRAGQTLNPGNAGAVARFLIGLAALTEQTRFETPYAHSLGQRPQTDLLDALQQLGAQVESREGRLPLTMRGPVQGGQVSVRTQNSSQYASALIFLGPLLPLGLELRLTGRLKSVAAIRQTLDTLRTFGIQYQASEDLRRIQIPGQQAYQAQEVAVPGDYPGSVALLVAGALRPGRVSVSNLRPDDLQGERSALDVLERMGAKLERRGDRVTVCGGSLLRALTADGDPFTDAVQALSAAAALAQGTTTWTNVATLRLKECDRISETRRELQKLGVQASETADSLSISGPSALSAGVSVDAHGDHRLVMMLSVLGLCATAPIRIRGAQAVRKSYPLFFEHLRALGARVELAGI